MKKRKGFRSKATIPESILTEINRGKMETANLVEFLAVDFYKLIEAALTDFGQPNFVQIFHQSFDHLEKKSVNTFQKSIGKSLLLIKTNHPDTKIISFFSRHPSDVVRRWPCYFIGLNDNLNIDEKLSKLERFAIDHHFGVREDAWLAVRNCVIDNLEASIFSLSPWIKSDNAYKRRFAVELLRPRGVWCKHINQLKEHPELVMPLIEELKEEKNRYVQDSVANWLNDLSKSQPELVINFLKSWDSTNNHSAYIIKRSIRSIKKGKSLRLDFPFLL